MADDYDRRQRDFVHALGVYARCNGTEWAIMMTIMQATWGQGRDDAPIGRAVFATRITASTTTLWRSVRRLMRSERASGLNLLQEIRSPTPRSARAYRINDDWRTWAWGLGDLLPHKLRLAQAFPAPSASAPAAIPIDPTALRFALDLREHARTTVPAVDMPDPDQAGGDIRWLRWCGALERILTRYTPARLTEVLRYAYRHHYWGELLRAPTADKRLEVQIDKIAADYDRQPTRQR